MISLCAATSSAGLFPMFDRFDIYRRIYRSRSYVLVADYNLQICSNRQGGMRRTSV